MNPQNQIYPYGERVLDSTSLKKIMETLIHIWMIFIPLHSFIHSFLGLWVFLVNAHFACLLVCLFVCLFVQKRGEGGALHVVVGHGDSWVCFVLFGRQRHHSSRFGQKLTKSVLDVYCTDFDGLVLWAVCGVGEDQ
jgi:hypothetical protein